MILNDGNKYLKTADAKNGEKVTFKSEGEWVENKKYTYPDGNPKQDFVILVDHNGEDKSMRLNGVNRTTLITAFDKDTSNWIGKSVVLVKTPSLIAGKKMDVLLVETDGVDQGEAPEETDVPF